MTPIDRSGSWLLGAIALATSLCAGCSVSHEATCFPETTSIVLEDGECEMAEARGGEEINCVGPEVGPDRFGRVLPTPTTWRAVTITNASTMEGRWTIRGASLDTCTADGICFAYVRVTDDTCTCDGGGVTNYSDDGGGTPGLGDTLAPLLAGTSVTLLLHNPGAVYHVGGCATVPLGP